jgi:hypothetical protein
VGTGISVGEAGAVRDLASEGTTVGTAVGTSPDATVGTLDGGAVSVAVAVLLPPEGTTVGTGISPSAS